MVARMLYLYEYVNASFDDVSQVLAERGAALFQDATDAAVERAGSVRADLVVDLGGFEVGRDVVIEVGDFDPVEAMRSKVHLRWTASEHAGLFPALEAEFEVAALSLRPPLTQVTLLGSYKPPGGPIGAAADAMFGHRIAEAAMHRFLHKAVERLDELASRIEHPTPATTG